MILVLQDKKLLWLLRIIFSLVIHTRTKIRETFHKKEQSILALISGNNPLTNQLLDSLSREIYDLNKSLDFSQNEYDDKFKIWAIECKN